MKLPKIAAEVRPPNPLWVWANREAKTSEGCKELAARWELPHEGRAVWGPGWHMSLIHLGIRLWGQNMKQLKCLMVICVSSCKTLI